MAKNKRKHCAENSNGNGSSGSNENDGNPLLGKQQHFLNSLPPQVRSHFFSSTLVTPDQRAEVWDNQADLGETLVNSYSWATPDPRLLKIFQYFGPIVEVGCGANAYWAKWMNSRYSKILLPGYIFCHRSNLTTSFSPNFCSSAKFSGGVDVVALDVSLEDGGKISADQYSKKRSKGITCHANTGNLVIRPGGPESLSDDEELRNSGRTLFLCYPDEEDFKQESNDDEDDGEYDSQPTSLAAACLEHFTGSTIIHVGELYGDTLSFDQAPFGRSSSSEFSQRLGAEYHCILKVKLQNNWLHVRDTLSVWKRSELCCMTFQDDVDGDDNDESDDEVRYKYIPPEEVLPVDCAAPCVAHLLSESNNGEEAKLNASKPPNVHEGSAEKDTKVVHTAKKRKRRKMSKSSAEVEAGNAW